MVFTCVLIRSELQAMKKKLQLLLFDLQASLKIDDAWENREPDLRWVWNVALIACINIYVILVLLTQCFIFDQPLKL